MADDLRLRSFGELVMRLRRPPSAKGRRRMLAAAVIVFAVAFWLSLTNLPPAPEDRNWFLLLVLVVGLVPATVAINAQEFRLTARTVGKEVSFGPAVRVSVLSSAANLLPVPGAVMVRSKALFDDGTSLKRSVASPAVMGLTWIATTALPAAVLLWNVSSPVAGLICGAFAVVGLTLAWLSLVRLGPADPGPLMVRIVGIEALSTSVTVLRYAVVIAAFGFDLDVAGALGLAVAGVLSTAAGFFPGGLGLREVLGAAISPLVGLDPAVAVLATAVDRVAGLAVLALLAGIAAAVQSAHTAPPVASHPGETES